MTELAVLDIKDVKVLLNWIGILGYPPARVIGGGSRETGGDTLSRPKNVSTFRTGRAPKTGTTDVIEPTRRLGHTNTIHVVLSHSHSRVTAF
jgi:hypothetical protein